MEIVNAIAAVLSKMGMEYIFLEIGDLILLLFVFFGVRKNNKLLQILLDKVDEYNKELDPPHLYSKFNKIEDNLDMHEAEEIRQLHDIHNKVIEIDATLQATKSFYNHREVDYDNN